MSMQKRFALDAKLRRAAVRQGFYSIALFTPRAYQVFLRSGTLPRSIELNVLGPGLSGEARWRSIVETRPPSEDAVCISTFHRSSLIDWVFER